MSFLELYAGLALLVLTIGLTLLNHSVQAAAHSLDHLARRFSHLEQAYLSDFGQVGGTE